MRTLTKQEIYKKANLSHLDITSSADIEPLIGETIKQDRAEKAIQFGLAVKKFGYNIFVSGGTSTKRRSYLKSELSKIAGKKETPEDLVYIYNFEDKTMPILVKMKSGLGIKFKKEMDNFITFLKEDVVNSFKTGTYKKQEEVLLQKFDEEHEALTEEFDDKLAEFMYAIMQQEDGSVMLVPINENGDYLDQESYEALEEETRNLILVNKKTVDIMFIDFSVEQEEIAERKKEALKEMDTEIINQLVEPVIKKIATKFRKGNPILSKYFEDLKKNVIETALLLKNQDAAPQQNVMMLFGGGSPRKEVSFKKYEINLLVDNSATKNAPIVFVDEFDPNEFFGHIEYTVNENVLTTDFTCIKAGDLVKANGGYLVMYVDDLFKYYNVWSRLKAIIKSQKVKIHSQTYRDLVVMNTLKPESIPLDVKIVLIGDYSWYSLLNRNDEEFSDLFKMHAVFDSETDRNEESELEYLKFISKYIQENDLKHLDVPALERVLEYSSRIVDDQKKLALHFTSIYKILDEADAWATIDNKELIDLEAIEKALDEMAYRVGFVQEDEDERLADNRTLITTEGTKVGEINALTVRDYGDFRQGGPARLSAVTYRGSGGVISIDRNVKKSGPIHDKGVETVVGFLNKQFAQEYPLSLNAQIVFEQNYGGIEGDSATSTTLYAILSDLSGLPIRQDLGVTGSMNQKGEVQVVGGVNEKIEGFFNACRVNGFTGTQGCILPEGNVRDLMLNKDVQKAVEEGTFHIYSVSNVTEGIELFFGMEAELVFSVIKSRLDKIRNLDKPKSASKAETASEKTEVTVVAESSK